MRYFLVIPVMLVSFAVYAAEPMTIQIDQAQKPKKFIPLDSARKEATEKQHGVLITKEKKMIPLRKDQPGDMRNDTQQMREGFMRLDRTRAQPIAPTDTIVKKPDIPTALPPEKPKAPAAPTTDVASTIADANPGALERDSEEIEGNTEGANPVLALFGASDVVPSSFKDAMSGRSAGPVSGVSRQAGWPLPLEAKQYLSSGYGMRADPFHGKPSFHGGIDIAADIGTPVLATADGDVMQVAQDNNYGKYITLQHRDGMLSRYGHLSSQTVQEGQRVRAGQVIGAVGSSGRATGSHLDYRVSKNGMKFDPLAVLTVPPSVPVKAGSPAALAVAVRRGNTVASNALPKRPMVIEVR